MLTAQMEGESKEIGLINGNRGNEYTLVTKPEATKHLFFRKRQV